MPEKKRKRDPQKTKKRLLDTAERVFTERGFDGARVDEIAAQAKINKGMIYILFGSKEALYDEVLKRSFRRLFKSNRPESSAEADPVADTAALVRWYFWFLSDNPHFVRLFGWESLTSGKRAGKVLLDLLDEGLGPLQVIIRRGKEQGCFRDDIAVHKLVAMVNEMCLGFFSRLKLFEVLWHKDLSNREHQEEMLDQIITIILNGIRANPQDSARRG